MIFRSTRNVHYTASYVVVGSERLQGNPYNDTTNKQQKMGILA